MYTKGKLPIYNTNKYPINIYSAGKVGKICSVYAAIIFEEFTGR